MCEPYSSHAVLTAPGQGEGTAGTFIASCYKLFTLCMCWVFHLFPWSRRRHGRRGWRERQTIRGLWEQSQGPLNRICKLGAGWVSIGTLEWVLWQHPLRTGQNTTEDIAGPNTWDPLCHNRLKLCLFVCVFACQFLCLFIRHIYQSDIQLRKQGQSEAIGLKGLAQRRIGDIIPLTTGFETVMLQPSEPHHSAPISPLKHWWGTAHCFG